MASRKEQKERARQERLAAEQAAAAKAARVRRVQLGAGGVVAAVAVVAVVVAIAAGSGGKSGTGNTASVGKPSGVTLPAQKIADLPTAAKAAGCVLIDTPQSISWAGGNRQHVDPGTKVKYATNPPSYGEHYPAPASDGIYQPKDTPATGYLVHALEHGRIEYQYSPSLPQADVKQLQALYYEGDGSFAPKQYLLLFQNPTNMPYAVAAAAWGHVIGCKTWSPGVIDALRDFRLAYSFKGPETAYTGPE
jgi:hypothetical protein